jgi:hypothetical protein
MWTPLMEIMETHTYAALFAFVPGFVGAYAGYFIRYLIKKK